MDIVLKLYIAFMRWDSVNRIQVHNLKSMYWIYTAIPYVELNMIFSVLINHDTFLMYWSYTTILHVNMTKNISVLIIHDTFLRTRTVSLLFWGNGFISYNRILQKIYKKQLQANSTAETIPKKRIRRLNISESSNISKWLHYYGDNYDKTGGIFRLVFVIILFVFISISEIRKINCFSVQ